MIDYNSRNYQVKMLEEQKEHWRGCISRGETGQAALLVSRIGDMMVRLFVRDETETMAERRAKAEAFGVNWEHQEAWSAWRNPDQETEIKEDIDGR